MNKFQSLLDAKDMQTLKTAYKKMAMICHPDRGGNTSDMQELNNLYEKLYKVMLNNMDKDTKEYTRAKADIPSEYMDIISKLIVMEGVEINIIGTWIWLMGNTFPYKDDIKLLGFRWSSNDKRKAWYYTSDSMEGSKRYKKTDTEVLKNKYGCTTMIGHAVGKLV